MKRLTHEKMKEIEELVSKKEHPDTEKYKAALEKGQSNLEKYKKMAVMTQNVLRVIFTGTLRKKMQHLSAKYLKIVHACNSALLQHLYLFRA